MKIYRLSQEVNCEYDTYDSAIVYAESEESARKLNPNGGETPTKEEFEGNNSRRYSSWTYIEGVDVEYIGSNDSVKWEGIILSSFNAG